MVTELPYRCCRLHLSTQVARTWRCAFCGYSSRCCHIWLSLIRLYSTWFIYPGSTLYHSYSHCQNLSSWQKRRFTIHPLASPPLHVWETRWVDSSRGFPFAAQLHLLRFGPGALRPAFVSSRRCTLGRICLGAGRRKVWSTDAGEELLGLRKGIFQEVTLPEIFLRHRRARTVWESQL